MVERSSRKACASAGNARLVWRPTAVESQDDLTRLDGWRIGRLREQQRVSRLEGLLLDDTTAAARIELLESLVAELQSQLPPPAPEIRGHLLFRPTSNGYVLHELDGTAPELDQQVLVDGRRYRVERVGRSPLPADGRPCLVLAEE
jgi:hypothetical protein